MSSMNSSEDMHIHVPKLSMKLKNGDKHRLHEKHYQIKTKKPPRIAKCLLKCAVLATGFFCAFGLTTVFVEHIWIEDAMPNSAQQTRQPVDNHNGSSEDLMEIDLQRLREPALPHHEWFKDDPQCARFATWFARPGTLPATRLVSFFRSGNTWSRYLLEAASGFVTCDSEATDIAASETELPSLAEIREQIKETMEVRARVAHPVLVQFLANYVDATSRTCITAKTHQLAPLWRQVYYANGTFPRWNEDMAGKATRAIEPLPAILLIRDPFLALVSHRHFKETYIVITDTKTGQGLANSTAFHGKNWTEFVEFWSSYWFDLADDWATSPRQTLIVFYEDLIEDTMRELRRMLQFLGVAPPIARMRCVQRHLEGIFHNREHPVTPDATIFPQSLRAFVWKKIRALNDELLSRGYHGLPMSRYTFFQ